MSPPRGGRAEENLQGWTWLAALLDLERPGLYQCLPEDFNLGHRLPPGQHPLIRRKGCVPTLLPKPRPWDARLVLEHRRWVWLGSSGPSHVCPTIPE